MGRIVTTAVFRRRGADVRHLAGPLAGRVRYYDLKHHWTKRIVPHLEDRDLNRILVRELNKYRTGLYGKRFMPGMLPEDIDCCDWRCNHRAPHPRFWAYASYGTCHWIANFALRLANLSEPGRGWRILTSDVHTTVWDGDLTLFDFNYQAMGIPAMETFEAACRTELPVGAYKRTYRPPHWSERETTEGKL
jgi:hypothetical protein